MAQWQNKKKLRECKKLAGRIVKCAPAPNQAAKFTDLSTGCCSIGLIAAVVPYALLEYKI